MHQVRFAMPIADRFDLGLDIVHESMSGATPWYVIPGDDGKPVQVMTGATIEDKRTDALLEGKYYMDRAQASLSGGVSFENDYFAINGGLGGQLDLNEKNTTLSSGLGVSIDSIDPVDTDEYPLRPEPREEADLLGVRRASRRCSGATPRCSRRSPTSSATASCPIPTSRRWWWASRSPTAAPTCATRSPGSPATGTTSRR